MTNPEQGFMRAHRSLTAFLKVRNLCHSDLPGILVDAGCRPSPIFQLGLITSYFEDWGAFDLPCPFSVFWLTFEGAGNSLAGGPDVALLVHAVTRGSNNHEYSIQLHSNQDGRSLSAVYYIYSAHSSCGSSLSGDALVENRFKKTIGGDSAESFVREMCIPGLSWFLREYNRPTNFVVEYRPPGFDQDNARRKKKKMRQRRPINLILGRDKVVRLVGQGHGKNKKQSEALKAGHLRRGHWRTLHHERYGENVGKLMWIKACWVGPEEGRDEYGAIYRVILDERKLKDGESLPKHARP